MATTLLWNVNYWSERLQETTEKTDPLLRKLYSDITEPLTFEERFLLRERLTEYQSYSNLLRETLTDPGDETKLDRLKKKLFRK